MYRLKVSRDQSLAGQQSRSLLLVISLLISLSLACNLPIASGQPSEDESQLETQVAQTIAAQSVGEEGQTDPSVTPDTSGEEEAPGETPSPTVTSSPTASPTPQPGDPDLVFDSISIDKTTIKRGEKPYTTVSFQIKNVGESAVEADSVEVRIWDNGSLKSGTLTLNGSLEPGDTAREAFAVGNDDAWPFGSHSLYLEIDRQDYIKEENEGNNQSKTINFDIERAALPDLIVSDIQINEGVIRRGDPDHTQVKYVIKNVGSAPVQASSIYVRDWLDGSPTPGYMELSGPLPVGATRSYSFDVGHNSSFPYGIRQTQVEVDHREEIAEENEGNNLSSKVVYEVIRQPDIYQSGTLTLSPSWTADLDQGVTAPSSGRDLWLDYIDDHEGYLRPQNSARMAFVATDNVGPDQCASAPLSTAAVNVDDLYKGAALCYETDAGRYGVFEVLDLVGSPPEGVKIEFETFQ